MSDFWENKRVLVTGGAGFLGKAVVKKLLDRGSKEKDLFVPRSSEYDLREKEAARAVIRDKDLVIHLAATVGGIAFNKENAGRVFYDNVMMAANLIDEAWRNGVKKFIGIGSIVEHPEFAEIPFREEGLWNGYPDKTNGAYAMAKRFMLAQSQFYRQQYGFNAIHLMPVKVFGPGMSFDLRSMQVIAALMQKITDAKKLKKNYIEVWGTGRARREFIYVDDAAEAIVLAAELYNGEEPVNVGSGQEVTIAELAETLCRLLDFKGQIHWDASKPEGQLRSVCDTTKAKELFRFSATTSFEDGLQKTVAWYKANHSN